MEEIAVRRFRVVDVDLSGLIHPANLMVVQGHRRFLVTIRRHGVQEPERHYFDSREEAEAFCQTLREP